MSALLRQIQSIASNPSQAGYDPFEALRVIANLTKQPEPVVERMGHVELADPEDMAIELEEVRAASRVELDAAFEEGCEDGEFSPERWREGRARASYVDGWNRCNPEDQR